MGTEKPLIDPYLSLYAFFDDEGDKKREESIAFQWATYLAHNLEDTRLYTEETLDQIDAKKDFCLIYRQHDTWVVYASTSYKGQYPLKGWQYLSNWLFKPYQSAWQSLSQDTRDNVIPKIYWGTTLFFGAEVADLHIDAQTWFKNVPLLPESDLTPEPPLSEQAWGNLWQVAGLHEAEPQSPHIYMVLAQKTQIEHVKKVLFQIDNMDLIALSLHKAYHHLQQYEQERRKLHQLIHDVDEGLNALLTQPQPTRRYLSRLSQRYLTFNNWASKVTELQNTVAINASTYHQIVNALELSHAKDHLFKKHSTKVEHGLAQIEADKVYYDAALQRVGIGLETLRADLELHQAQKERQQAKREKRRDLLLAELGLLLGFTQLWPILQNMMQNANWLTTTRQNIDAAFVIFISLVAGHLLWQLRKYRNVDEDASG